MDGNVSKEGMEPRTNAGSGLEADKMSGEAIGQDLEIGGTFALGSQPGLLT